jgi:hypothetical protein
MMHNMYRDYIDGFVPTVEVTKREDNGHYTASACGLTVTHYDQAIAVNNLQEKIREGLLKGEIHP